MMTQDDPRPLCWSLLGSLGLLGIAQASQPPCRNGPDYSRARSDALGLPRQLRVSPPAPERVSKEFCAMRRILGPAEFAAAFHVSRETLARLATYEGLLRQWQSAVNLVAASTLDAIWHRHFADSAQLLALAPGARAWVDLGSGAGFPGLVIALLLAGDPSPERPGPQAKLPRMTLIESNARKCAFLREVVRATRIARSLSVDILSTRIETATTQVSLQAPDVVSARAVAP